MRLGKAGMAEAQPRDTVDGGRYGGRNGGGCEGEGTPDNRDGGEGMLLFEED